MLLGYPHQERERQKEKEKNRRNRKEPKSGRGERKAIKRVKEHRKTERQENKQEEWPVSTPASTSLPTGCRHLEVFLFVFLLFSSGQKVCAERTCLLVPAPRLRVKD